MARATTQVSPHHVTYQVLARKWRPRNFDEVTGQAHVTTPLRGAIRTGRIPHAVLLTGPRGVGKTSLARILARCLNCEKGPTEDPCGSCSACEEIAAGASTDVQEIDAASRTSVDDVREIIESIRYAPSPGKHRIYVVDEVHMLSTPAFNALLKTLEEPPPRSLFVFATTNPEKIPYTVISRCQRYDLRRIPTAEVAARLGEVAAAEELELSPASLAALARAGEGSLRDALTLLDQVVAYAGTRVDDTRVAEVLDLIDARLLAGIAEACVDGDPAAALRACRRAWEAGVDAKRLGAALLGTLRDLVVLRLAPDDPALVEGSDADLEALRALAGRAEEPRLRRMFRALLKEQEDLAYAPEPFAVLEMAVVRLASMAPGEEVQGLLARLDALERKLRGEAGNGPTRGETGGGGKGGGGAGRGTGRAGGSPRKGASPRPSRPQAPQPAKGTGREPSARQADAPRGDPATEPPGWEAPPAQAAAASELPDAAPASEAGPPPPAPTAPEPTAPLPVVFDRLRAFAQDENRGLFAALEGGRLAACEAGELRIELPSRLARRRLGERRGELEAMCARFFGHPVRVRLTEGAQGAEAARRGPARGAAGADPAVRRARHEALRHPAVNDALEILSAEILEIHPLGASPTTGASSPPGAGAEADA